MLKRQINTWYEDRNGYSIQSFNPDGQPINVFDIRLRNSHFQLLKPFCHVQSSTDIGPSSTWHQFYSGKTTFEEAQRRQKQLVIQIPVAHSMEHDINSKNDKDNDLDNDIQVNEPDKSQADCIFVSDDSTSPEKNRQHEHNVNHYDHTHSSNINHENYNDHTHRSNINHDIYDDHAQYNII